MKNLTQFLNNTPNLPKVVKEWMKYKDVKEIKGPRNNPIIMGLIRQLGKAFDWIKNDEIPYCSSVCAAVYQNADKDVSMVTAAALSWLKFGKAVNLKEAVIGDVLVFKRPGGGHVGTYVGENKDSFYVFGANQSNAINIARMSKSRLVGVRRPIYKVAMPEGCKKNYMDLGGAFSENEQ